MSRLNHNINTTTESFPETAQTHHIEFVQHIYSLYSTGDMDLFALVPSRVKNASHSKIALEMMHIDIFGSLITLTWNGSCRVCKDA